MILFKQLFRNMALGSHGSYGGGHCGTSLAAPNYGNCGTALAVPVKFCSQCGQAK